MKDAVLLPWQAVRSAWAVSMTEGWLGWADATQWSLNRISSSQLAVMNSQNASSVSQKIRICKLLTRAPVQVKDTTDVTNTFVLTVTTGMRLGASRTI